VKWRAKAEQEYQLVVDGLVEKPVKFSYRELRSLPQVKQVSDFHCVEGWSVKDVSWGGFRFEEILKRVKADPQAAYAVFHALGDTWDKPEGLDHYVESFPLKNLVDPAKEYLLSLDMDNKPLSDDHGAPLRLVTPYDLAYKSIKYVTRIELTKEPRPGWWTLANPIYPINAPVPASRLRIK
jgi:DMSO/TMAO reductase YedYZ molybdopterin-dependent catalytic subunit